MDERFTKVLKDPRFKRISKKERKVKIDSRFEKMFTDKRFHNKVSRDKRGKPINDTEKEDLHKFYEIESDQGEGGGGGGREKEGVVQDQNVDIRASNKIIKNQKKQDIHLKNKTKVKMKKKAGEDGSNETKNDQSVIDVNGVSSSDDSDNGDTMNFIRGEAKTNDDESNSSDSEVEELDLDDEDIITHGWGELDEDSKRIENAETNRLAVCNCDWDKIGASDLYVLFHSFAPTGGVIKSVKIYPSDFGIKRMKEEDTSGPLELKDTILCSDEDSGDENAEGSKFHMEKLREYQLNRMKYYYAVVVCDSKDTANTLYEECDGMEYEMSATRMDVRFIPDDTTFDQEPKSVATKLPSIKNYEPAVFLNTALQQSTVRLSWDETDVKRSQKTMRQFTKADIEDMDFKDYLASSSDEEDINKNKNQKKQNKKKSKAVLKDGNVDSGEEEEEEEDSEDVDSKDDEELKIKKYRLLMAEIEAKEKLEDNNHDGEMEVAWEAKKKSLGDKLLERNKIKEDETTKDGNEEEEDYSSEEKAADLPEGDTADAGFDDPFFQDNDFKDQKNKKKKKKRKRKGENLEENMTEEEKKNKKELELLLLDETEEKKHFNLKTILEQEKLKKTKKRKKKKHGELEEDTFELDLKDPRFDALYSSHLYALDPSEPHFKKTKSTDAIIKEIQIRRNENGEIKKTRTIKNDACNKKTIDPSLAALVKSVKSKTQSHQLSKKRKKPI